MFRWIKQTWNSVFTKLYLMLGSDVNNPKAQYLHWAVWAEDISLIDYLLKRGAKIDGENSQGYRCLYYAFSENKLDVAKALLSRGASFDNGARGFSTLLHNATKHGWAQQVSMLLSAGVDVDAFNDLNYTALYLATIHKQYEIAELLLQNGARLDLTCGQKGRTVLHAAAEKGDAELVELFLKGRVDVNQKDYEGETALLLAFERGHTVVRDILLSNGASIDVDKDGARLLCAAAGRGSLPEVHMLLAMGAKAHQEGPNGFPPLYYSLKAGDTNNISYALLDAGAQVDWMDGNGHTLLYLMAASGNERAVSFLLRCHADVNGLSIGDNTPFYVACWNGYGDIAQLLWNKGAKAISDDGLVLRAAKNGYDSVIDFLLSINKANVNSMDSLGRSALWHALNNKNYSVATKLFANHAIFNKYDKNYKELFIDAVKVGEVQLVNKMLHFGMNADCELGGHSALYYAIKHNKIAVGEALLKYGAAANIKDSQTGESLLAIAIKENNADFVRELLKHKANPDALENSHKTPIYIAISKEYGDIALLLLERSSHPAHIQKHYLLLAVKSNLPSVVKYFIEHGVTLSIRQELTGKTLLHLAAETNNKELVKLLVDAFHAEGLSIIERDSYGKMAYEYAKSADIVELLTIPDMRSAPPMDELPEDIAPPVQPHQHPQYQPQQSQDPYANASAPDFDEGEAFFVEGPLYRTLPNPYAGANAPQGDESGNLGVVPPYAYAEGSAPGADSFADDELPENPYYNYNTPPEFPELHDYGV